MYFRVTVLAPNGQGAANEVERSHKERSLTALAAAACAEYLNEHYHHQLDPDAHAIETEELYDTIIERQLLSKISDDRPLGGLT
jgi:hypothetical protein